MLLTPPSPAGNFMMNICTARPVPAQRAQAMAIKLLSTYPPAILHIFRLTSRGLVLAGENLLTGQRPDISLWHSLHR